MNNSSESLAAIELLIRRRARESILDYCNAIEVPSKPIGDEELDLFAPVETSMAKHHVLLLSKLEETANKPHGRLMVFMPPGSAKSTYASVVFPSQYLGKNPNKKLILASYGDDLARKMGRRTRSIIKQRRYSKVFNAGLTKESTAANEFSLTNGSEYMSSGILGGITGNRANGIIIDDPIKGREQANSATIRNKTWDAYEDDIKTRLLPQGFIIIIQTRWHEDDLSGRILPDKWNGESGQILCRDGNYWEVICLQAKCELPNDPLGREIGEYLWPEWFDAKHWSQFESNPRTWNALFQQRPTPLEGNIFKIEWWKYYTALPAFKRIIQSWDTAFKAGAENDFSVCTTWGETDTGYYLIDLYKKKVEYPDLKRAAINLYEIHKPHSVLVEDKASGQTLLQELRRETIIPIVAIKVDADKLSRANAITPIVESGRVYLPENAPWLLDFIHSLAAFPNAAHDDDVDSTTQALNYLIRGGGKTGLLEFYAEQARKMNED